MQPDGTIATLAGRQYGLFTYEQAMRMGFTPKRIRVRCAQGVIERIEPRVYRVVGAPTTWHQRVLAACWAEDGLASHRTAAALWPLDGCKPGIVEVLTERWRRRPNRSVRIHETRLLHPDDRAEVDGIPVTSKARTIIDLAAVLPPERVEQALDTSGVDPEEVWACVERLDTPGRPWVAVVRRLVAARLGRNGIAPNMFENRLFAILVAAGLPLPTAQVEIRRPDGTLVARVDWLFAAHRVILECDSFLWHGSWMRRKADLRRDRELTALGYRVLRFSWEDLDEDERQVATDVDGALSAASA